MRFAPDPRTCDSWHNDHAVNRILDACRDNPFEGVFDSNVVRLPGPAVMGRLHSRTAFFLCRQTTLEADKGPESHNWDVQNPAIQAFTATEANGCALDELFVLLAMKISEAVSLLSGAACSPMPSISMSCRDARSLFISPSPLFLRTRLAGIL
jgi:hypothetical protein